MKKQDLTGLVFGRLVVVEQNGLTPSGKVRWLCRCKCGTDVSCSADNLRSSHTQSCGCIRDETLRNRATHGMTGSAEYGSWNGAWERTTNPRNKRFGYYGGRGIRVCDEWKSFEVFLKDMGRKPTPGHWLDRIDNDGNYCASNCRWATPTQQARNRSITIRVPYQGRQITLGELSEISSIPYDTLYMRLHRGRRPEELLS